MKAYVIKNKEGKYYCGFSFIISSDKFENDIKDANIFEKYELNMFKLTKDCTIVPITIYEGDLEEENRVLKKALKLACEELETRDEGKTHARLFIQKIKNNYLGDNVGYEEYFIQQAKEIMKDEMSNM